WKAEYEASRPRCQKCGGTLSRGESIHRLESQVRGWTRCNVCGDLIILFSRPIGDGDIVS
ncbi:MAG: hypothetical protein LBH56_05010, partial [Coriobacteriales bacterium]|nr:hypothetical protein [Coriobacteriales bacterium]